ncbi:MAG: hypothetical protein WC050_01145 [Candidatus Paceibacterota bacterium]
MTYSTAPGNLLMREETRYKVLDRSKLLEHLVRKDALQVTQYERPFVLTVYFGYVSAHEAHAKELKNVALRVRFYLPLRLDAATVLNDDMACVPEIKERFDASPDLRNKTRLTDVPVPFREAKEILTHALRSRKTDEQDLGTLVLTPLYASHFHRTHFERDHVRISVDRDIAFYSCINKDADCFLIEFDRVPFDVAEIKVGSSGLELERELEKQGFISRLPLNFSKGYLMFNSGNKPDFEELDIKLEAENKWEVIERETKLDIIGNATGLLARDQDFLKEHDFVVGAAFHDMSYHKVLAAPPDGITIMSRHKDFDDSVIKFKRRVRTAPYLERIEKVIPYSVDALGPLLGIGDVQLHRAIETGPIFSRQRVRRNVYSPKSRLFFEIFADHCEIINRPSVKCLDQIEVELVGKIDTIPISDDKKELDAGLQEATNAVMSWCELTGLAPQISTQTKYDWVTGHVTF